jgi:dihydroorotate dehydrogenase
MIYESLLRPILFNMDPEKAHDTFLSLRGFLNSSLGRSIFAMRGNQDPRLEMSCFGLKFQNPVGLAAGFDKNAVMLPFLSSLGFGHIETGTVTARPQPGNERPRIFRYPEYEALINRMGFPSEGADVVCERLKDMRPRVPRTIVGVNFGKSRVTPLEGAAADYLETFQKAYSAADYFVINVSSPNTPELVKLQEKPRLEALFRELQSQNHASKPLLVKISPDLTNEQLDDVLECCSSAGISGVIATNTTLSRDGLGGTTSETGGLSGRPLNARSLEVVERLTRSGAGIPVVAAGGIFTSDDVWEYLRRGARLCQVYTGFVYRGPRMVGDILAGLSRRLEAEGVRRLEEVVGSGLN